MAEYIEREAAIDAMCAVCTVEKDRQSCAYAKGKYGGCDVMDAIKQAPAADVAPVRHGLWLTKEYMYGDPAVGVPDAWVDRRAEQSDYYAWCSLCGGDAPFTSEASLILSDWCPNCGADMREVSHE